ncbi:hypothetical protein BUALT_Bualt04G0051700 [Buddleja alternifolia]|uniref:Uncharacterized protein n=1 Tax=Buddleja alternifolia TaxID=168488 RepID=A0AAV6XLH8_9LAMI|nr:hypothetical protein BUALT_Bualt04G0051700 [Buddleja alternifolia]
MERFRSQSPHRVSEPRKKWQRRGRAPKAMVHLQSGIGEDKCQRRIRNHSTHRVSELRKTAAQERTSAKAMVHQQSRKDLEVSPHRVSELRKRVAEERMSAQGHGTSAKEDKIDAEMMTRSHSPHPHLVSELKKRGAEERTSAQGHGAFGIPQMEKLREEIQSKYAENSGKVWERGGRVPKAMSFEEFEVGFRRVTLEIGEVSRSMANGAVVLAMEETKVLSTVS